MAYSNQRAVSDGTLKVLMLTIDFFDKSEISVLVDDIPYPYIWATSTSIEFQYALNAGSVVVVRRTTDISEMRHVFTAGAQFTNKTLDEDYRQILHIAQESSEGSYTKELFNDLDMHQYKIRNLGPAEHVADAVPLGQVREIISASPDLRRAVRAPSYEGAIAELPPFAARAGKVMGFDALGNPVGVLPMSGSATELALDLASPVFGKGAGMVGWMRRAEGARARTADDMFAEVISLADFVGFDPTGATDSSAAWKAALAYIATLNRNHPSQSIQVNGHKLVVPAGDYLITEPSTLALAFSVRAMGLTIEAQGHVRVIYAPTTSGPLFVNNDRVLFLRVTGIIFIGQDANSDLFWSMSTGGGQDYVFTDCVFHGSWRYGMNRVGTNTNSELKWNGCSFSGKWVVFDYIAETGTSDQFVNNWYTECKYWSTSPWVEYWKGGHVRMVTCDISGYSPEQLPVGEGPGGNRTQYLVKLFGSVHASGVCSFTFSGVRAEQKNQWAGILWCKWTNGSISFSDFDSSSQSFLPFAPDVQSVYIDSGNDHGPVLRFEESSLLGKHVYTSGSASVGSKRITYEDCTFTTVQYPDDAFVFTDPGGQVGRRGVVHLLNCRGRDAAVGTFASADLNWSRSMVGHTSRKMVSLKTGNGVLPNFAQGPQVVTLPIGAVILGVIIHAQKGASPSAAAASYTVTTSETVPTVLATLALARISDGGTKREEVLFPCTTREQTRIQIVPSADMAALGGTSFCTIEYIG